MTPQVKPLSYTHRNIFFYTLAAAFCLSLPFLFLYATGYRINLSQSTLLSTGGLYIAAERTGAEIYIDNELVRETRVFRRAFYSQGLEEGTHRVHVQKEGHHTWVKELPVYPHLVTEAQAFNLPINPQVRLISSWQTNNGVQLLTATSTVLENASATNQFLFEPRAATSTLVANTEYESLIKLFIPETENASTTQKANGTIDIKNTINSLTQSTGETNSLATTTKEWRGVRLYENNDKEVFATFVGPEAQMPYYYCADDFAPYTTATTTNNNLSASVSMVETTYAADYADEIPLEVQTVTDESCDPTIKMDTSNEAVNYFDFFPNSTDLVILGQDTGIYVVEIDDRAWQNKQPLLLGKNLIVRVQNGSVYVFDGKTIYQIVINQNWF